MCARRNKRSANRAPPHHDLCTVPFACLGAWGDSLGSSKQAKRDPPHRAEGGLPLTARKQGRAMAKHARVQLHFRAHQIQQYTAYLLLSLATHAQSHQSTSRS